MCSTNLKTRNSPAVLFSLTRNRPNLRRDRQKQTKSILKARKYRIIVHGFLKSREISAPEQRIPSLGHSQRTSLSRVNTVSFLHRYAVICITSCAGRFWWDIYQKSSPVVLRWARTANTTKSGVPLRLGVAHRFSISLQVSVLTSAAWTRSRISGKYASVRG